MQRVEEHHLVHHRHEGHRHQQRAGLVARICIGVADTHPIERQKQVLAVHADLIIGFEDQPAHGDIGLGIVGRRGQRSQHRQALQIVATAI